MAYVLDISPSVFVASKYALTCMAALIILILRNVIIRRTKLPAYTYYCIFSLALSLW